MMRAILRHRDLEQQQEQEPTIALDGKLERLGDSERRRNLEEIWRGMALEPRRLPCKLFYDAEGSRLFERITGLPEYYLTRCEVEILERQGAQLARRIGPHATLVEFGSGASVKTRLLLDALEAPRVYVPIDICADMLSSSARALRRRYPGLSVRPLRGDYMRELELPLTKEERGGRVVAFFPGSTIGNFEHDEAVSFLRRVRRACGDSAELLIGVDLPKERALLEAAYDDAEGVTALFNLNVLRVLEREYRADFRPEDFVHRATWNELESRVEMHLVSRRAHSVHVAGREFSLRAGEPIVTEHCYKHSLAAFRQLVESAGFSVHEVWLDSGKRFSVQLIGPS